MENSNPQPEEQIPAKRKERILIGVLAFLLLGSLAFNLYQAQKSKQQTETFAVDLKDSENAKNQLQGELDSLSEEFEKTRGEISVRDSLLSKRDAEIFDKQKEIQNILNKSQISESELKRAKRMITALNADIGRFKQEINELKQKNDSLWVANENLNREKTSISDELNTEKEKAAETENNIRSTFSVSNYKITGLQVRNSGKEVETDKAKRIDKLRVSFDLDPNEWAETGEKEIYITIFKPDGTLGKFKGADSGELETWSLGTVNYSDKITFNYTKGTRKNISFDWEDYDFPKGNYKIDLYQNGFKIGQKSLELK
jgi:cell division protein FtsB